MDDARGASYYVAVAASAVSMLAWLAAGVGALATLYFAVAGGPTTRAGVAALLTAAVAIVFARVEKRLHRPE